MKRLSCLFILAVIFCVSANAQSNDNFKKLQEMSLDPIYLSSRFLMWILI